MINQEKNFEVISSRTILAVINSYIIDGTTFVKHSTSVEPRCARRLAQQKKTRFDCHSKRIHAYLSQQAKNRRIFTCFRKSFAFSKWQIPKLSSRVVHVAGTKGKGSTCAFVESIIRHHGYSTGNKHKSSRFFFFLIRKGYSLLHT